MTLPHGRPSFTFHASEKVVSNKRKEKLPRAKVLYFQRSLKRMAFSSIPWPPSVTMNGLPKSYLLGPSCSCAGLSPRDYDFLSQCLAIINIKNTKIHVKISGICTHLGHSITVLLWKWELD